jgi:hypothetical protein
MAIFRFHIRDQHGLVLDEDGVELPDALAAAREALRSAQEFFRDASAPTNMTFEITDETGRLVLAIPIRNHATGSDEGVLALAS